MASADSVHNQVYRLTSFDTDDTTGGTILNQITRAYNDFQQLTAEYQSHSGAVVLATTPRVLYEYSTSSANTIRPLSMTYPNGRNVRFTYGSSGTANNQLSRPLAVQWMEDASTAVTLQSYSYLGLSTPVIADNPEPDVRWTLVGGSDDPDTGDTYTGLDRFGRIKDCRWQDYGSSTDAVRLKYGYDRDSNRLWRQDDVARALSQPFDELYTYDGLQRLQTMQRGTLNSGHAAISSQTYGQCWNLDSTENWTGMKQAEGGSAWTLEQARSANQVNEITDVTNSVGNAWSTPTYDGAGNMTRIPMPNGPSWSTLTGDEWDVMTADEWDAMTVNPAALLATWDAWNRLVKLVDESTGNIVEEYQYDAAGRRIIKKLYVSGTLSETRQIYLSSQNQVLEEVIGSSTDAVLQNVWGLLYIDGLILRDRDTDGNGTLDERRYCLQDANWNAVALTDASGDVTQQFCYQPFGTVQFLAANYSSGNNAVEWTTLFTGRELDTATSLYYFRTRYLSAVLGIFLGRDLLKYSTGSNLNAAYFVPNSSDPAGLYPFGIPPVITCPIRPALPEWINSLFRAGGGASEAAIGVATTFAPEPTLTSKVVGPVLFFHGLDTCIAALRSLYCGEFTPTMTSQGISATAECVMPEEYAGYVGVAGDAIIGMGGSAYGGKFTQPTAIARRGVDSELCLARTQYLENGSKIEFGTVGAYSEANYLFPRLVKGRSSRAGGQGRYGFDDEMWGLINQFKDDLARNKFGCSELQCIQKLNSSTGGMPQGGVIIVRSVRTGNVVPACDACKPILERLGIQSVSK